MFQNHSIQFREFQPITDEKKILLEIDFNENIEIFTDKDRISRVFKIKNSIDFVPNNHGIVTIVAKDRGNMWNF